MRNLFQITLAKVSLKPRSLITVLMLNLCSTTHCVAGQQILKWGTRSCLFSFSAFWALSNFFHYIIAHIPLPVIWTVNESRIDVYNFLPSNSLIQGSMCPVCKAGFSLYEFLLSEKGTSLQTTVSAQRGFSDDSNLSKQANGKQTEILLMGAG